MKRIFLIVFSLFVANVLCARQLPEAKQNMKLSYKIIRAEKNTWGYNVYKNDRLYIHQPVIPAIPGNNGFATKADAEKVVKKVIEKMQNGENIPSVSVKEMQQMGVLPNNKNI